MEKLKNIISKFQILQHTYEFEIISNGFINDTYLVSHAGNPTYVLQRINTKVFININSLIKNLDLVLPLLDHENYQSITLAKTDLGDSFFREEETDDVWRLMTFIKGSVVYNTTTNPEIAYEAGKIIGLFHKLLADVDVEKLEDTLPKFHNISFRHEQFEEAFKKAKPETIEKAQKAITFVEENISMLKAINLDELPVKACHNDTKLNNILFSKSNKALCLIDLDTIMKGTFLYDFGDAIRTIANTAVEDEKDLSIINFTNELFDAFIDGLAVNGNFLSQKEKELLPLGPVLLPFLHGIRALTDYLDNNRYYKVSYETQNLDRSFSLFQFAQLAIDNQEAMKKSIAKKLE
ncbi:MAG: aminoglycoside phosphotransferase family protein [Flavobacteriaceae bacterium]|nr:aminoglycoside phosphotransferase family protein [Flavobacteriaceae bacterium]